MENHLIEIPRLKVMVVDDHKIFRKGMRSTLENIEFVKEIIDAESGNACLDILKKKKIDIIFMDISMQDGNGFETTKIIAEEYPDIGVIALSLHEDEDNIRGMLDAGALGYLFKNTDENELREAMDGVYKRKHYFTSQASLLFFQKLNSQSVLI